MTAAGVFEAACASTAIGVQTSTPDMTRTRANDVCLESISYRGSKCEAVIFPVRHWRASMLPIDVEPNPHAIRQVVANAAAKDVYVIGTVERGEIGADAAAIGQLLLADPSDGIDLPDQP